jgi:hypothetical protein
LALHLFLSRLQLFFDSLQLDFHLKLPDHRSILGRRFAGSGGEESLDQLKVPCQISPSFIRSMKRLFNGLSSSLLLSQGPISRQSGGFFLKQCFLRCCQLCSQGYKSKKS